MTPAWRPTALPLGQWPNRVITPYLPPNLFPRVTFWSAPTNWPLVQRYGTANIGCAPLLLLGLQR